MLLDYRIVDGYPDYIISNYGIIYSTKRYGKVIEMKQAINKGYKYVNLCKDGIRKIMRIHVLVGNAFIGMREGEMTFDHVDRNPLNNRADNIRLATKSEQQVNKKTQKRNKFGEKNISTRIHKKTGNEYYNIQIRRNKKIVFEKHLNKKKYTIEDAVKVRDDFLITL